MTVAEVAALVSQLRSGSTSLLVRTVEGESKKQDMEKEESVADMVTRAVEAWCAEEIEVKPVEVPAEMAEVDEIPDFCMSDTSNLSDDEMEDIVMKLRQQSKDQETGSKSEESDYDESDADQELCVDESILSTAKSYWSNDYEFTHVYDEEFTHVYDNGTQYEDELWLATVSWAIVANKGEMEPVSPAFKSTSKPASGLTALQLAPAACRRQ